MINAYPIAEASALLRLLHDNDEIDQLAVQSVLSMAEFILGQ